MKCEFFEGLSSFISAMVMCCLLILPATVIGCADKETVLDVETPNTDIEVQRDVETGETDVEVNRDVPNN